MATVQVDAINMTFHFRFISISIFFLWEKSTLTAVTLKDLKSKDEIRVNNFEITWNLAKWLTRRWWKKIRIQNFKIYKK